MADKAIPTLTAASALDGTEQAHVVQSSNSRRTTTQDIADLYDQRLPFDNETGTTYATVATDNLKYKRMDNAAAIAVTISDVTHNAGDEITFEQAGAGQITFAAGGSLTLNSSGGKLKTAAQHAVCTVKFITASEAVIFGDLVV